LKRAIVCFHASAELYGSDQALLHLARGLDPERFRLVFALPREGPLAARLREAGATVEVGPVGTCGRATLRPSGLLRAARDLPRSVAWARDLLRRHRPDVVHTNTLVVLSGALAAQAEALPHVWHVHEILQRPRWLARALASIAGRLSVRVVSNSRATEANLLRANPRLAAKSVVIRNGVPGFPDRPETRSSAAARAALAIDAEGAWIALVGRVNAWKGQRLLLDAIADARPRPGVLLAGDAPPGQPRFLRDLEARIARLGLESTVVRLPFVEAIDLVHAAADVVVVPSLLPEPFGLVAAEAMSLARPVVAARHGGLLEIVADGETGLLFTPGSAADLARAIRELLADPARAREMGRRGRIRQRRLFSVDRYCAEFAALYDEISPRATREAA